ncbi:MAG: transposase [bacterium]|nr:transposase [bacterium]
MTHLLCRQKGLKTLAFFVLLQYVLFKEILFSGEKGIFAFYIPEGHILRRIEERVDFKRIGKILETKYSGKITPIPRIEPIALFKLYLVMFLYPIHSERELCRRAHSDMAIRWFCDFGLFGKIPDHSIISKFRARVGAKTFLEIFEYIVHCCVKVGLVKGNHISIDGSKLPGNARRYTSAEQARRLTKEYIKRLFGTEYVEGETKEQEEGLKEIAKVASKLVGYPVQKADKVVEKIKMQAKEMGIKPVKIKGIPVEKAKEIKEKVSKVLHEISHARGDSTARVGRTSSNENYCGYLQSFAYDYPVGVFTACYLEPADTYCSNIFIPTYEAHKKNVGKAPDEISLDRGYDEIKVREILEKDKVKAYISLAKRENKYGVYSTEMFEFNEKGELICPAEKRMERLGKKPRQDRKTRYKGIACQECELRKFCTTVRYRTIEIIEEEHKRRQEAEKISQTPEHKSALKKRLRIEGGIGHLKDYHLLRRALYRNKEMIKIQQLMSVTSSNIEKLVWAKI